MTQPWLTLLRTFTGHRHIFLTSRGNESIVAALRSARSLHPEKRTLLIPDQGGWLTYRTEPKKHGLNIIEVKTDNGVFVPSALAELVAKHRPLGLLYQHPAGYFAEQPVKEIYEACGRSCIVILDVSGIIGSGPLGDYADIMLGSFGHWKPVGLGYGGFISTSRSGIAQELRGHVRDPGFSREQEKELTEALSTAAGRLSRHQSECERIKRELKGYPIIHPEKKGIVVVVEYATDAEQKGIIEYCERHKYPYTLCPRYIRVLRHAVSIEVKRGGYDERA
jgi:dTDP-4-amino-4,6-dideoxygalactose transaminase